MSVIQLAPPVLKQNAKVVALLERILLRARSGELTAVAVAGITSDNKVFSTFTGTGSFGMMAGAIAYLEHRYHENSDADAEMLPEPPCDPAS